LSPAFTIKPMIFPWEGKSGFLFFRERKFSPMVHLCGSSDSATCIRLHALAMICTLARD